MAVGRTGGMSTQPNHPFFLWGRVVGYRHTAIPPYRPTALPPYCPSAFRHTLYSNRSN